MSTTNNTTTTAKDLWGGEPQGAERVNTLLVNPNGSADVYIYIYIYIYRKREREKERYGVYTYVCIYGSRRCAAIPAQNHPMIEY